jgi:5-methyltetrahydropteroyltriglutamate--homocysteine methyltransferase
MHDGFPTTHAGSLIRSPELLGLLTSNSDPAELAAAKSRAVAQNAEMQDRLGITYASDGEAGHTGFYTYLLREGRLTGYGGPPVAPIPADVEEQPQMAAWWRDMAPKLGLAANDGPVNYQDTGPLQADIARFKAALQDHPRLRPGAFMSAPSPGTMVMTLGWKGYPSREAALYEVGAALRTEYLAIAGAGLTLQIDAPDLLMGRHTEYGHQPLEEFLDAAAVQVDALNHALRGIDPGQVRLHSCYGNYRASHRFDVPLEAVLPIIYRVRARMLLIANTRPQHRGELEVFGQPSYELPADRLLGLGLIDTLADEPEAAGDVADQILTACKFVPAPQLVATTYCGFATFAQMPVQTQERKLIALVQGAALASERISRSRPA